MIKLLAATLMALPLTALADPVLRVGNCPAGYYSSGSYCMPTSASSPSAIPKVGNCPAGYYSSSAYCIQSSPGPVAIPRVSTCPAGYYGSGDYCKSSK